MFAGLFICGERVIVVELISEGFRRDSGEDDRVEDEGEDESHEKRDGEHDSFQERATIVRTKKADLSHAEFPGFCGDVALKLIRQRRGVCIFPDGDDNVPASPAHVGGHLSEVRDGKG